MANPTDIRPAGTEPGPGDLDADGYIWIFVVTGDTFGNHWWRVSARRRIFWQKQPWLPGWSIPVPSPTSHD